MALLLDENVSPAVARALVAVATSVDVVPLQSWQDGSRLGAPDDLLLKEAAAEGRVLVTYDLRTIPPLLRVWVEAGQLHAGVIFVDQGTIPPGDVGALARALARLVAEAAQVDWTNRVEYLQRVR